MAQSNIGPIASWLQQLFAEQDGLKRFLEAVIQQAMAADVDNHLGAGRHERTEGRSGYRNGSKPRRFKTRVG